MCHFSDIFIFFLLRILLFLFHFPNVTLFPGSDIHWRDIYVFRLLSWGFPTECARALSGIFKLFFQSNFNFCARKMLHCCFCWYCLLPHMNTHPLTHSQSNKTNWDSLKRVQAVNCSSLLMPYELTHSNTHIYIHIFERWAESDVLYINKFSLFFRENLKATNCNVTSKRGSINTKSNHNSYILLTRLYTTSPLVLFATLKDPKKVKSFVSQQKKMLKNKKKPAHTHRIL